MLKINDKRNGSDRAYTVSLIVLFVLWIASFVLYKQRMLFVDPGWITFNIINTNNFVISEHRYGSFITQLFPLLASLAKLPLSTILFLYSGSFFAFFLTVAYVSGRYFKQKSFAILLAFYFTLMASDVFFWPNNEVHQGVAWMILFFAAFMHFTQSKSSLSIYQHLSLSLLAFLALFSHIIVLLPFVFIWLYLQLDSANKRWTLFYSYSVLIASLIATKYILSMDSWYDGSKLEPVKHLTLSTALSVFNNGHAHTMYDLFLHKYWIIFPIFLAGIYALWKKRKFWHIALVCSFIFLYTFLVLLTFSDAFGRELYFYMESEWMALTIIISLPFVFEVVPKLSSSIASMVVGIIFLLRFYDLSDSFHYFNKRFHHLEKITNILEEAKFKKTVIKMDEKLRKELFIMDWGLPIESLLLSSMNHPESPLSFKAVDESFVISPAQDSIFSCFQLSPQSILDKNYFKLEKSPYHTIKYDDLLTTVPYPAQ